jgi:phosphopantothenoylcysteine synthetase/decarboxylase
MNVVVTGGGTVAPIDDVRTITNMSSGRFSAAITEACLRRNATVWHVHAPSAQVPFQRSARFDLDAAEPAAEIERLARLRREWLAVRERLRLVPLKPGRVADYAATLERLLRVEPIDVAFLAMAVSDFEPEPVAGKISSSRPEMVVRCKRTQKVIRSVRDWAPSIFLVGFKLVSGVGSDELIRQAEAACRTNRADLTVGNDVQLLRAGRHTLHLVGPGHVPETLGPSETLAEQLVDRVLTLAAARIAPA